MKSLIGTLIKLSLSFVKNLSQFFEQIT